MVFESTITDEAKKIIRQKLIDTAKNNNVIILLAVESGSRAWGFPSTNSDYDVRFIYARTEDEYLSVKPRRDVIETDIVDENALGVPLDLNGWDVRKALQLAVKSNAVLIEWLQSPIKYSANVEAISDVLKFVTEITNLQLINKHYYKIMINTWKQIEENANEVKVKHYCYALRPALASQWIRQFGTIPPMDMKSLCDGLIKDTKLYEEVCTLITLKATAKESDIIPRNFIIDSFIKSILSTQPDAFKEAISDETFVIADKLFRKIIGQ